MIIPGTTPTHTFTLPFDTSYIKSLRIFYADGNNILLTKELKDATLSGNQIIIELTQEDTLLFKGHKSISIQCQVLNSEDESFVSTSVNVRVLPSVVKEVLV